MTGRYNAIYKKKAERWEIIRLNKIMRSFLADILLEDLTTEKLQEWVDFNLQLLSPSSVNREFSLLRNVLEVARKRWKWIEKNPCGDVDKPKDPPPRDRRISQHEINRILTASGYIEGQSIITQRHVIAVGFFIGLGNGYATRRNMGYGLEIY